MIYALEIKEKAVGKGRPRINTKTHKAYTPQKTKDFEELVRWHFVSKYNVDTQPSEKPFKAKITAEFRPPLNTPKKAIMIENGKPYMKKPDSDNIAKSILDALNGLAYKDDTQVVELEVIKKYGLEHRITIVLEELV